MEDFAQGIVAGFAVSMTIPAMYYFNKAALGTLFVVNREIGKALVRVIQPNETRYVALKHTCDKADCTTSAATAAAITTAVIIATAKN